MKRFWVLLMLLPAACGTLGRTDYQPLTFQETPWQRGEQTTLRVTDINGNYAGTASYTIAAGVEDGWVINREIIAQGDAEVVTVEVSANGFRPAHSLLTRANANGQQSVAATYSDGDVNLVLTSVENVVTYETRQVPSDVRDQRTLLMVVRALPLAQGYATRINTFYPIRGQMERVIVAVDGEEEVTTPLGTFTTWRVDLINPRHESQAWYSQDAPYLLVKYVDGETGGTYELADFMPS